jgi:hypothetical protein
MKAHEGNEGRLYSSLHIFGASIPFTPEGNGQLEATGGHKTLLGWEGNVTIISNILWTRSCKRNWSSAERILTTYTM